MKTTKITFSSTKMFEFLGSFVVFFLITFLINGLIEIYGAPSFISIRQQFIAAHTKYPFLPDMTLSLAKFFFVFSIPGFLLFISKKFNFVKMGLFSLFAGFILEFSGIFPVVCGEPMDWLHNWHNFDVPYWTIIGTLLSSLYWFAAWAIPSYIISKYLFKKEELFRFLGTLAIFFLCIYLIQIGVNECILGPFVIVPHERQPIIAEVHYLSYVKDVFRDPLYLFFTILGSFIFYFVKPSFKKIFFLSAMSGFLLDSAYTPLRWVGSWQVSAGLLFQPIIFLMFYPDIFFHWGPGWLIPSYLLRKGYIEKKSCLLLGRALAPLVVAILISLCTFPSPWIADVRITDIRWDDYRKAIEVTFDKPVESYGGWTLFVDDKWIRTGEEERIFLRSDIPMFLCREDGSQLEDSPNNFFVGRSLVDPESEVSLPCSGTIQFYISDEGFTNKYEFNLTDTRCSAVFGVPPAEWTASVEITDVSWDDELKVVRVTFNDTIPIWDTWRMYVSGEEIPISEEVGEIGLFLIGGWSTNTLCIGINGLSEPEPLEEGYFPWSGTLQFFIPGEGFTNEYEFNLTT